jgi:putative hydrolase of the HAD superfamily
MLTKKELETKTTFIFDFFHTLTEVESKWGKYPWTSDYLGIDKQLWGEYLQNHSRDRLIGKIKGSFEITKQLVMMIDPSIPDEKIRYVAEYRVKRFAYAVINIPEYVGNTLSFLKSRGKKIGLISNADNTELAEWNKSPIAKCFDSTILSFEVGLVKPDKEIYELSLKMLNSSAEESVFVGDGGSSELEGAKKCGLSTVMVEGVIKDFLPKEQINKRRMFADYNVQFIDELVNVFDSP